MILVPFGNGLLSPILNSLIDPLGVSAADIGLMISVFTTPSVLIISLAGVLADRYGRKPLFVSSILLSGLAGTAIALTTNYRVVLLLPCYRTSVGPGSCHPSSQVSVISMRGRRDDGPTSPTHRRRPRGKRDIGARRGHGHVRIRSCDRRPRGHHSQCRDGIHHPPIPDSTHWIRA